MGFGSNANFFEFVVCCKHPTNETLEENIYPPGRQFSPRLRAPLFRGLLQRDRAGCAVKVC